MYQWLVFLHLLGVFGFLISHGVSVAATFALRKERDPKRVQSLLQISSSSISAFYPSLLALLIGGVGATFDGDLWGYGWIWWSIALLVLVSAAMYAMARPYYRRLRFVTEALIGGSKAVTAEQYDAALSSSRPVTVAAIGFGGLAAILYLMLFKPALGMSPEPSAAPAPAGATEVALRASELSFEADSLIAPASQPFALVFENESQVPHNVSIYEPDGDEVFKGEIFTGPRSVRYAIPALAPGSYRFVCDVHPAQMTGDIRVS